MGASGWLQNLRRLLLGGPPPVPPALIEPGARVRLRMALASSHRVWIPSGAVGIVVGWDTPRRRVSIELDSPRTVVTVPWAWIEEEPLPGSPGSAPSSPSRGS